MIRAMKEIEVAKNPDELIDGMYEFFAEVGLNHAFIDQEEELGRGNILEPWQSMTHGILKDKSLQGTVFKANLQKLLDNKEAIRKLRQK